MATSSKNKRDEKQKINSVILPSDQKMDRDILRIMEENLSVFKDDKGKYQDIICNRFGTSSKLISYFKKLIKADDNKKAKNR